MAPLTVKMDVAEAVLIAEQALDQQSKRAFNARELAQTLRKAGFKGQELPQLVESLLDSHKLRRVRLRSPTYKDIVRLIWRDASVFEIGLSLKSKAYLSHGTAVHLHGLTDQLPSWVIVNKEQSAKGGGSGELTQTAIDRAFANNERRSNYIFRGDDVDYVLLNGKNTGNLEVGTIRGSRGEELAVTKLERTLIDIAVRPSYAGGVVQVLEAYRAAVPRLSVGVLLATLKKLDYLYPYHQTVGFLLDRSGVDRSALSRVSAIPRNFDFYFGYGSKERAYDEHWRLFFPKGL